MDGLTGRKNFTAGALAQKAGVCRAAAGNILTDVRLAARKRRKVLGALSAGRGMALAYLMILERLALISIMLGAAVVLWLLGGLIGL